MSGGLMSGGRMSGGRLSGGLKSYDREQLLCQGLSVSSKYNTVYNRAHLSVNWWPDSPADHLHRTTMHDKSKSS